MTFYSSVTSVLLPVSLTIVEHAFYWKRQKKKKKKSQERVENKIKYRLLFFWKMEE